MDSKNKQRPRLALSLGGGGARTFAHLGIIDALRGAGIPIDYLITCSAASVICLMAALGAPSRDIINEFSRKRQWLRLIRGSIFKQVLREYLKKKNITDLKQSKIPISIITADLKSGMEIIFDKGDPLLIALGSCAFPGLYQPIKYKNYYLVDGGVLNPDPADIARQKAGSKGIVVSVTLRLKLVEEKPGNRFNTILKSLYLSPLKYRDIIMNENSDIIIAPLNHLKISFSDWKETFFGYFSSHKMEEFYQKGYLAGKKASLEIKKLILL